MSLETVDDDEDGEVTTIVVRIRVRGFSEFKKPKDKAFAALWSLIDNWDELVDAERVHIKKRTP